MKRTILFAIGLSVMTAPSSDRAAAAEEPGPGARDCNRCPWMVLVDGDRRSLASFEISRHEVTHDEYLLFVESTGRADDKSCAGTTGTRRQLHVGCVTWPDAEQYAEWLSELTGRTYRLPSETQWTYADQRDSVITGMSAGGAWEWMADCWHPDHTNAPADGSAWIEPGDDCPNRVVRPGRPLQRRTEHSRLQWRHDDPERYLGFRVVRLLKAH